MQEDVNFCICSCLFYQSKKAPGNGAFLYFVGVILYRETFAAAAGAGRIRVMKVKTFTV
jgi:hypothetical protein